MIPRLKAAETVDAIMAAQLAHPIDCADPLAHEREKERRQTIFDGLQRKALGEPDPAPARAAPANPDDLAGMGIAMTIADPDAPQIADLDAWLGNVPEVGA